ncbi:MAG: hypothetical protein ACYC26_17105 [Phycisphaerales bacterium]
MTSEQIASLQGVPDAHLEHFRHCFACQPTFEHLGRYICGLMSGVGRKSIEHMALAAAPGSKCRLGRCRSFFRSCRGIRIVRRRRCTD